MGEQVSPAVTHNSKFPISRYGSRGNLMGITLPIPSYFSHCVTAPVFENGRTVLHSNT